jgi:hypothetical protein
MRFKILLTLFTLLPFTSYLQILSGPALYVDETTMEKPAGKVSFESFFLDKTMRLDLYHSGNSTEDHFAVDQIVSDGIWPGSKTQLVDPLNLGMYFFEVIDNETKMLIYSRGYCSIFGEWQSTPEAEKGSGTFHESLRFPWPKKPVLVVLKKRNPENKFQEIWNITIDPSSQQVNPADINPTHKVDVILDNGPASQKLDIVILGDGYSTSEMEKFRKDTKRLTDVLLSAEPFKSRKNDLNIRAIEIPAAETGVTKPQPGVFKRSPLSVSYSIFGSERYALTFDNKTVRNIAAEVPYDLMIILINEKTYGGGGIYNLYTTVSADNKYSGYIMVHEFGHHMGGLADEYYTSSVSYEAQKITVEPWEPNITALLDKNNLKWESLVEPGIPLPTPWNKEAFDSYGYKVQKERDSLRQANVPENIVEDLFTRQYKQEDQFFAAEKYADKVGAFEGADYTQKGLYRPQVDCIMYTRHMKFCKVCRSTLESVIDEFTK